MAQEEVKIFKLYDQAVIVPIDTYSGINNYQFKVFSGSRILLTMFVKSIDVGANVNVKILNSFTLDNQGMWDEILSFDHATVGYKKQVLTDFNKFFDVQFNVTGGEAELVIAISVFDNAMTTRIENAMVDVDLDRRDFPFRPHDSVRIGNQDVEASWNSDGSLNVNLVNAPSSNLEIVKSVFNESPAIPTGVETLIVAYTVPLTKKSKLQRVEFSGQNIAIYNLYLNGTKIARKDTWFNGPMHGSFEFTGTTEEGPELVANDLLELKCIHVRPLPGDFSGRIQSIEID